VAAAAKERFRAAPTAAPVAGSGIEFEYGGLLVDNNGFTHSSSPSVAVSGDDNALPGFAIEWPF
jgi:hypothetical protein